MQSHAHIRAQTAPKQRCTDPHIHRKPHAHPIRTQALHKDRRCKSPRVRLQRSRFLQTEAHASKPTAEPRRTRWHSKRALSAVAPFLHSLQKRAEGGNVFALRAEGGYETKRLSTDGEGRLLTTGDFD